VIAPLLSRLCAELHDEARDAGRKAAISRVRGDHSSFSLTWLRVARNKRRLARRIREQYRRI
jgi:hypothetical protein